MEHFWLMQMAIVEQNKTYILCVMALPPSLSKNCSHVTVRVDIYRCYEQIQYLKKLEYCS